MKKQDESLIYSLGRSFIINPTGQFESLEGYTLSLPMLVPPLAGIGAPVSITLNGMVSVFISNSWLPIGQLQVAKFAFSDKLNNTGNGYYEQTVDSGEAQIGAAGTIGFETIETTIQSKIITVWFNQQWEGTVGSTDFSVQNNKPFIKNISTINGSYKIELNL